MLKIHTSYAKKIPGSEDYSSQNYHVGIEVEVADEAAQDPVGLRDRIHSLFEETRKAIELEIAQDRNKIQPHAKHRPLTHDRPAIRDNGDPASPKQMQYLISLASRQHGMSVDQLNSYASQEVGCDDVGKLSKKEASALIECLKS